MILDDLYASEISFSIVAEWDAGSVWHYRPLFDIRLAHNP
jgi:hypothetical protein